MCYIDARLNVRWTSLLNARIPKKRMSCAFSEYSMAKINYGNFFQIIEGEQQQDSTGSV